MLMRIAYICPGTGGAFYCENCVRDYALAAGLRALGHEVDIVPMYLPPNREDAAGNPAPVMFGAVKLYLTEKFPALQKVPESLLNLLDRRPILGIAAGFAGSTRAGGHEEMTINMILGEEGPYADEFDKLAGYLINLKPDAVFLPNAFMLGVASAVKAKSSSIAIVCILQDEHIWVDASANAYRERTWGVIAKKLRYADRLYSHSYWYGGKIAKQLGVPQDAISTVPFGVDPGRYEKSTAAASAQVSIGYLSRLCREMGMDVLSEAYCRLLKGGACGEDSAVEFCGGYTRDDNPVVKASRRTVERAGGRMLAGKRFDIGARSAFLSRLSALSVPSQISIACGGFVTEAMAAGVPAVLPDEGGFSEVIAETGAGLLYSPNTPEALAEALGRVIRDGASRRSMAEAGVKAVAGKYNYVEMARMAAGGLEQ
jgi:glycosyltransferase involved in cell wall biosynthesis